MSLQDLGLLTDENIHPEVVEFLREQGFDVVDVRESSLIGVADAELIRMASSQNRAVVTHDRDFARLALGRSQPLVGIVYLRPGHVQPTFTIATLRVLLRQELDVKPPFVIVAERAGNDVHIRVRRH